MESKKIVIAPINSESDEKTVFFTLKEFPTQKMIFLTWPDGIMKAEGFSKELEKLGIESNIVRVANTNPWEGFFRALVDVCAGLPKDSVVINISSADRVSQCALTNAAHVNGLKAIAIIDGKMIMLPILKIAFSAVLSDKKMKILDSLKVSCSGSLEDISKKTGMSLQLVSYHVNGTLRSKGLNELEMVDTNEEKGKTKVCLSSMGRLFMDGYINSIQEERQ